jgi:hypothetical protein
MTSPFYSIPSYSPHLIDIDRVYDWCMEAGLVKEPGEEVKHRNVL